MKHTKGPWKVLDENGCIATETEMIVTACARFEPIPHRTPVQNAGERATNARLIAAAPELLEALQEFLLCGASAGHNQDLLSQCKSAIAKATGGVK